MNKFTFIASVCAALFVAACGNDSSSVEPSLDESSSSVALPLSSASVEKLSSNSTAKSSGSKVTEPAGVSSSSVVLSSSSVTQGPETSSEINSVEGSLTDSRDGQTYKIVTIGTQMWMAQNLNYRIDGSYCRDGIRSSCTKYGRLYTWAAAMDSAGTWSTNGKGCGYYKTCTPTYPVRGVCPTGWHLPTQMEWRTLYAAVGGFSTAGTKLKSTSGWYSGGNGTDDYSFSALPAGNRDYKGDYYLEGHSAYFWSSTEYGGYYAWSMYLNYYNDFADLWCYYKNEGFSVRCVQD